jgi:hypothetical protein
VILYQGDQVTILLRHQHLEIHQTGQDRRSYDLQEKLGEGTVAVSFPLKGGNFIWQKKTAGRMLWGSSPQVRQLNDDVLFGRLEPRGAALPRDRSLVTVVALMARGWWTALPVPPGTVGKNGITGRRSRRS